MIRDNKKIIKQMFIDACIAYIFSAVFIIMLRAFFAFNNDEALFENIMLNFRTFLLGVIDANEYFFVARIESIGLYAIHLSLIFALFFNFVFDKKGLIIVSILGIIILIICRLRFILCIHIGMTISLVLYALIWYFGEKRHFLALYRAFLIICSIFPILLEIMANI